MGSRITKVLGYGIPDLETSPDGDISDKRVNADSFLLNEDAFEDRFSSVAAAFDDYLEFLKGPKAVTPDMDITVLNNIVDKKHSTVFQDLVTHDPEYGFPELLTVTPLSCHKEWIRSDDAIDYVEASLLAEPMEPIRHIHWNGFYPFSTGYINRETGEKYEAYDVLFFIRALNAVTDKTLLEDFRSLPERNYHELMSGAERIGFDNYLTAMDMVIPEVPNDVINLATWSDLIPNSLYFRDLRPISYTYWA